MWTWFYDGQKSSRYYNPGIYSDGKLLNVTKTDYGPDFYSRFVLDFIDQNKDKPFFIYYPMALVHSPFDEPPSALNKLAEQKYNGEMGKKEISFGHMMTYADEIVGKIMERLKANGLDKNTLVIFTGDNGMNHSLLNQLPGMKLQGGKGSLTEAGCRVPFMAWWPGTVKPAVKDEFICLVDVLPTICSVAGIGLTAETDGMDLSHYFTGSEGTDREQVFMSFKSGYFVRDKRFRLHEDGKLYDIPVTSDKERYSEKVTTNPEYNAERERLQKILDGYMALPPLYDGATKADPGAKKESKKERKVKKNAQSE
jgi:arylsulfatase A